MDSRYGGACCTFTGEMATRAGTARFVVAQMEAGKSARGAVEAAIEDLSHLRGGRLPGRAQSAPAKSGSEDWVRSAKMAHLFESDALLFCQRISDYNPFMGRPHSVSRKPIVLRRRPCLRLSGAGLHRDGEWRTCGAIVPGVHSDPL